MTLKQFTEALKKRASTYPLGILGYDDFCIMVDEVLDKCIKTDLTDGAGSTEPHGLLTSYSLAQGINFGEVSGYGKDSIQERSGKEQY